MEEGKGKGAPVL